MCYRLYSDMRPSARKKLRVYGAWVSSHIAITDSFPKCLLIDSIHRRRLSSICVYHIMIIIKISKKRILIRRIFHFRRCQIILWWNKMQPFERVWLFGCCHSGHIPSNDYGIPTCSSNDIMRKAVGLSQAARH